MIRLFKTFSISAVFLLTTGSLTLVAKGGGAAPSFSNGKDVGPKHSPSIPVFPGAKLNKKTTLYDEAGTRKVYLTKAHIETVVSFYKEKFDRAPEKGAFWYEFALERVNLRYKKESYNFLTWGVQIRSQAGFTEISINDFDGAFLIKRGPLTKVDEEYRPPNLHEPTEKELEWARKKLLEQEKKRKKRE